MKFECGKVSFHNKLVACAFSALTAASAYQVGSHYGWDGHKPGSIDNFAIAFSLIGFAVAMFCVLSVPLNRVACARLACCAVFVSYSYLAWSERLIGWTLLYDVAAAVAGLRLIEEGFEKEMKRL